MLGIEKPDFKNWIYLVSHDHLWKQQLYVKGRKQPGPSVWTALKTNNLTLEQAVYNWDLSPAALNEIIEYCELNQDLIQREAAEELRRLREKGIEILHSNCASDSELRDIWRIFG